MDERMINDMTEREFLDAVDIIFRDYLNGTSPDPDTRLKYLMLEYKLGSYKDYWKQP